MWAHRTVKNENQQEKHLHWHHRLSFTVGYPIRHTVYLVIFPMMCVCVCVQSAQTTNTNRHTEHTTHVTRYTYTHIFHYPFIFQWAAIPHLINKTRKTRSRSSLYVRDLRMSKPLFILSHKIFIYTLASILFHIVNRFSFLAWALSVSHKLKHDLRNASYFVINWSERT